jgi:hypothetical protein
MCFDAGAGLLLRYLIGYRGLLRCTKKWVIAIPKSYISSEHLNWKYYQVD